MAEPDRSVERLVELNFVPDKALLFVIEPDVVTVISAQFVPLPGVEPTNEKPAPWLLSATLLPKNARLGDRFKLAALVEAKDIEPQFFPPLEVDLSGQIENTSALRERLLARKHVLDSWGVQLEAQAEALRRLRDDADTIANFGRIIDAQDELSRSQSEFENLGRDIENLQKFLILIKNYPEPRNFVRREGELTRQLAMLSEVAKKFESSEGQRTASAEVDLRRKTEIVEATRNEDLDALQRQLFDLRRARARRTHEMDAEYGNQRVE